ALTPTNLITLAHFSVSSAMNWPKSTGEPASAMPPTSATGQIVTSARLSAFGGKADIGHIDQAAMSRGLGERVVSANCITIGETLTIMEYSLLKFFHILGAVIMGGGLIGVWMADLRSRQLRELKPFSEAVRNIAVFYDGLVVPGALLPLASGTWMIVNFYGGWNFLGFPWLAGMVGLFAFEFIEGNTITRLYFMRLRRVTRSALNAGDVTLELQQARGERVPTFTHFLDLPLLFLIVALGAIRPTTWLLFFAGSIAAVALAIILTLVIPRLYPWGS